MSMMMFMEESEGNLLKKMQSLPENTVILIIRSGCLAGSNGDWEDTSTKWKSEARCNIDTRIS